MSMSPAPAHRPNPAAPQRDGGPTANDHDQAEHPTPERHGV
ncbi:hypothetical protein [Nonomuraea roseola]|uniref:Uncharacterized protein n=1 Tax=Nonomuraea roseola TaxID=46179 RepID=A0ABV5Q9T6_9ACTN